MSSAEVSVRIVLTDADIVAKLSLWELFEFLPTTLRCEWSEIATLPSLVHRAHRACTKPDKLFPSQRSAEHALASLQRMRPLPDPAPEVIALLQDSPQIDAGEAVLIGAACAAPAALLATGDKRALLQLTDDRYRTVEEAMAGRIVSFEQLIVAYIDGIGIELMRKSIAKARDADLAIANCFGSQLSASEANVREGLRSYVNHLRQQTGLLLAREVLGVPAEA